MATRLLNWARNQKAGGPVGKLVLMFLADTADADGVCWPKMKTIADDAEISISTVQRTIIKLEELGLVEHKHRSRAGGGWSSNEYKLKASVDALRPTGRDEPAVESPVGQNDRASKIGSKVGQNDRAHSVTPDRPRSVNVDRAKEPPLGTISASDEAERARAGSEAFNRVIDKWMSAGGKRDTSWGPSLTEWRQWVDGFGEPALEAAALSYLKGSGDARRDGPKALQYWLKDEDFRAWLGRGFVGQACCNEQGAASSIRFPCEEIRQLVVESNGDDHAKSYLDTAQWDPVTRTITTATWTAFSRLSRGAWRHACRDVSIVDKTGAQA